MQSSLNNQKHHSFNRSVLAHSEVTPVKKNRALGTITKSCSTVDSKEKIFDKNKAREYRKVTTQLKERAGEILYKPNEKKQHRVCACGKCRIDGTAPVGIKYNATKEVAHYTNLQWCGSVWLCPDCSYKITQERKKELSDAMKTCRDKRFHVAMLTLTVPHYLGDDLRTLLKKMSKAKHALWTNRDSRTYFSENFPMVGHITATEVKYSDNNGWHPHFHVLLLGYFKIEDLMYRDLLAELWIKSCVRAGLNAPSMTHGLDLRDGTYADQYVSKWGIESELTKGHVKKGRNGGFTPFDLLQFSMYNESVFDKDCGKLFQEFAIAMKGSRQLVWSRGLKSLLDLDEKTDEELAEETEKDAITLRTIDDFIFSLICHYQKRWDFLRCLERDYENGCFGTGETEQLLIDILEKEHIRLGIAS